MAVLYTDNDNPRHPSYERQLLNAALWMIALTIAVTAAAWRWLI